MYYMDEVQSIRQRLQCMNNYHTKHSFCRDMSYCYQEGQVMCHAGENSASNRIFITSDDMSFYKYPYLYQWCWWQKLM